MSNKRFDSLAVAEKEIRKDLSDLWGAGFAAGLEAAAAAMLAKCNERWLDGAWDGDKGLAASQTNTNLLTIGERKNEPVRVSLYELRMAILEAKEK